MRSESIPSSHRRPAPVIRLSSPDEVAAALSHLLGFPPADSLVVLWLRDGAIRLVQRVDLPQLHRRTGESPTPDVEQPDGRGHGGVDCTDSDLCPRCAAILQSVRSCARSAQPTACVMCIVAPRGDGIDLPWSSLVTDVRRVCMDEGCDVLDAMFVARDVAAHDVVAPMLIEPGQRLENRPWGEASGSPIVPEAGSGGCRWWSYLCAQSCCPPDGRLVPASVSTAVAAEFAWYGVAVRPSRDDVAEEFAPDSERQAVLADLWVRQAVSAEGNDGTGSDAHERWRDDAIARARHWLLGHPFDLTGIRGEGIEIPPDACGDILAALGDVRVRDTVLWHLVHHPTPRDALERLRWLVRAAPAAYVAPVATCAAIAAWISGDGVRARFAIDRALKDQPEYSLALLLRSALEAGMSGDQWRMAMSGLTEAECRGAVAQAADPGL